MKQLLTIVFIGFLCWGCKDDDNYDEGGEVIDQEDYKDKYKDGDEEGSSGYSDASPKEKEEEAHVNTVEIKSKEAKEELQEFWEAFQGAVAENNIDLLISMSALNFSKNNDSDNSLTEEILRDLDFDEEAHKQIEAAKLDDLVYEESPVGVKAYSFTVDYSSEENDEFYESAIIYYITKVKGEYKLISIFFAG